jgi:hypothetical protein
MDPTASFVARQLLWRFHPDRGSRQELDLCAIQRIRPDSVIETVVGEGQAKAWVGLSKHRMAQEQSLRDIQADVVLRQRAEVIRGCDPRLDAYLFKRFEHARLVRLFVPLIIFRDSEGRVRNAPADCWQLAEQPEEPHGSLVLTLKDSANLQAEAFGTVETGFRVTQADDTIVLDEALAICAYVTENAGLLHEHSLDYALEQAAERIRDLADGDSAVLQLLGPTQPAVSPYVVTRREHRPRTIRFGALPQAEYGVAPPRANAIGQRAVKLGTYVECPVRPKGDLNETLEVDDYEAYQKAGITTVVAFPLNMGPEDAVAFVHYKASRVPQPHALSSAWTLTKRCSQVLGAALEHDRVRDRAQQMSALNRVLMSLLAPRKYATSAELAEAIVWNTHNFLAADVVTLFEYDHQARCFKDHAPATAGRLKDPDAAKGPVEDDDVRLLILTSESGRIFASDVRADDTLNGSRKKDGTPSFIQREEIESTAAIVLKADAEAVGVLFANFRARRAFSIQEQDLIVLLADGCAAALKKLRQTQTPVPARQTAARRLEALSPAESQSVVPENISRMLKEAVQSYEHLLQSFGASSRVVADIDPELGIRPGAA